MIVVEGYSFRGSVSLAWPIAAKIVSLTSKAVKEHMLGGVTVNYKEYRKEPDPSSNDLSHVITDIRVISPNTIEVAGTFLATARGKEVQKMFEDSNDLKDRCRIFPNMYGLAAKKVDGTPDIEKETVCTVDILYE